MKVVDIVRECAESLATLKIRIGKYQKAIGDLAAERIDYDKFKKKNVKLNVAETRASKAKKVLDRFLATNFKGDLETVPDELRPALLKWGKGAKRLSFKMQQALHLVMLLPPFDVYEEWYEK